VKHPELLADWHARSNTLVVLAVEDEPALLRLERDAHDGGYRVAAFREPDLGYALTALALEPAGRRLVRRVSLALSSGEGVRT
jgi:hypothetical protein